MINNSNKLSIMIKYNFSLFSKKLIACNFRPGRPPKVNRTLVYDDIPEDASEAEKKRIRQRNYSRKNYFKKKQLEGQEEVEM